MNRVIKAVRMQYANATSYFWVPAMIVASVSLIVFLIGAIVPHEGQPIYSGAANAPFWFFIATGVTALTLGLPFALAMGVTRWEFSVAALFAALGAGGVLAALCTFLGWLEQVTNGYGVDTYAFNLPWFWQQGPLVTWLLFLSFSTVLFEVGFAVAIIYKRFGMIPLVLTMMALVLMLVGAIWFITWRQLWPQTLQFFAGFNPLGVALSLLGISLVVSGLGYLALRKYEVR